MNKETASQMENITLNNAGYRAACKKEEQLRDLDKKIDAILDDPTKIIEKAILDSESIPEEIDECSSQICAFLQLLLTVDKRPPSTSNIPQPLSSQDVHSVDAIEHAKLPS